MNSRDAARNSYTNAYAPVGHSRPSPTDQRLSHTARAAEANHFSRQMLASTMPSSLSTATWLLVLSFGVSAYVTYASVDHLQHFISSVPGTEGVGAMIAQYRWVAWVLLGADIITNALLLPGMRAGRAKARRGIAWMTALEALFNVPGLPSYFEDNLVLGLTISLQTLLQVSAVCCCYSGLSSAYYKDRAAQARASR